MVGGNDIIEFEEANIEALVEDFIEEHSRQYWIDFDGWTYITDHEQIEWATDHPEWGKFVEQRYAERGA